MTPIEFNWQTCDNPVEMIKAVKKISTRKKKIFVDECIRITDEGMKEFTEDQLFDRLGEAAYMGWAANNTSEQIDSSFDVWINHCHTWSQFGCDLAVRCDILREIFPPPLIEKVDCEPCFGSGLQHPTRSCDKCKGRGLRLESRFGKYPFPTAWRTSTVIDLANGMYGNGDFYAMPILADALEEAGCDDEWILSYCRGKVRCWCARFDGLTGETGRNPYMTIEQMRGEKECSPCIHCKGSGFRTPEEPVQHIRGCWAVDLILNEE